MVEVTIDSIRVSLMNYQRVVILKEKSAGRYLPIWIGPSEADAIAVKLQGATVPRPLTHDLLNNVIDVLGGYINSIVVSDLQNDTFYGKIILNIDDEKIEVDSRPSDALALAVRAGVPIYVEDMVLEKAGIFLDQEKGKLLSEKGHETLSKLSNQEMKDLSAFSEFINTLDLEDFNKRTS